MFMAARKAKTAKATTHLRMLAHRKAPELSCINPAPSLALDDVLDAVAVCKGGCELLLRQELPAGGEGTGRQRLQGGGQS